MTDDVLQHALSLAVSDAPQRSATYLPTSHRAITRRGILWLGQTCNLRCQFCYFLDRIVDENHPEHPFMSLDKAKTICRTLVDYYGNNSIDIQGGEPTLFPGILELTSYCAEIGLSPTLITNAQALSKREVAARYRDAGIRDFLISVQGLGDVYDTLVGQPGGYVRQMKAIRNLQEVGIPFRFNTVLSKPALPQLPAIAELAIRTGAKVVNLLGFNPFNDQTTGKRTSNNVASYSDVGRALTPVLDTLAAAGVEANVRYLPHCVVEERHRGSIYDFQQIPYDVHENDYASWSWTDLPAQRTRDAPLTQPFGLGRRLKLGGLRAPVRRLAAQSPQLATQLHGVKQWLERTWADQESATSRETLYAQEGLMRSQEYTGYRKVRACESCDVSAICDGFYGDYADMFGTDEATPITVGRTISDPQHYTRRQLKVIHPLDADWLAGQASAAGA